MHGCRSFVTVKSVLFFSLYPSPFLSLSLFHVTQLLFLNEKVLRWALTRVETHSHCFSPKSVSGILSVLARET
jgi:hypothetical protein